MKMKNSELIKKLHTLKQINPDINWVVSARSQVLMHARQNQAQKATTGFSWMTFSASLRAPFEALPLMGRTAAGAAFAFVLVIAGGVYTVAQNSLPGDALYSVKVASEQIPTGENQVNKNVDIANRRVDELSSVAKQSNISSQDASAVSKQVEGYKKSLADIKNPSTSDDQAKQDTAEVNVIKESAQTLAVALRASKSKTDLAAALRSTISSRMLSCKDQATLKQLQDLLATGDIADLIAANELSVRCTDNKL